MDQLITASKAEININTRHHSPSITINNGNQNAFLSTANLDFSKYMRKSKDHCQSQWLNHLEDKPVLELISDNLSHKQFNPINPVELNCYERLKKLLISQNSYNGQEDLKKHSSILDKVAKIEDCINKAQTKHKQNLKRTPKFNRYIKSQVASHNISVHQSHFQSLDSTQKSIMTPKASSMKKKCFKSPQNRSVAFNIAQSRAMTMHPSIKQMVSQLKSLWSNKFLNHKKLQNAKVLQQFQNKIDSKLQQKIQEIFDFKFKKLHTSQQENQSFRMQLLQKNLTIQNLKAEMKIMEDKIISMEMQKEPQKQMVAYSKNAQQFYDNYKSIFGQITLKQLSNKLDFMERTFFEKYSVDEQKNLDLKKNLKKEQEEKQTMFKQKIQYYEKQQKQLKNIINQIRKFENLDNSYQKHEIYEKISSYKIKCLQLQTLQRFIFNKYIEWKQQKSEGETKLLNIIDGNTVEDYQQMIEAMLEFNKNYGNPSKNIESMTKLLSMIQKLKKIIAPAKCYEKLEPMKVLSEVESILKNKNQGSKRQRTRKMRTYINICTRKEQDPYLKQTNMSIQ